MYKAILCDDDEIIAQGLNAFIPWEKLGIYMCGFCYDGLHAKEMLDQFEPDILICDVCMPYVNGLELTKYAREKNPKIQVIVISGYDDFKYAQEAIKVGARGYLLKPVDDRELIALLKSTVEDCQKEQEQQFLRAQGNKYLQKNQVQCLIYEGLQAFVDRYGQETFQNMEHTACEILIAGIDNYEYLAFHLSESEQKEINEVFYSCIQAYEGNATLFERRLGMAGCYILGDNKETVEHIRNSYIRDVRKVFEKNCKNQTVTFACSNTYETIASMQEAYHEAQAALQERFVYSPGSNIYYQRIAHKTEKKQDIESLISIPELVALVKEGNQENIDQMLDKLQGDLLQIGGKSYLYMKIITGNIFAKLFSELHELNIMEADLGINSLDEYQKISALQSMEAAIAHLRETLHRIMEVLEKNNSHKYFKVIAVAENYIENHYMEHDLSMDKVAKQVHMSPSYFSVVFKNETSVSFTDYLIRIRIDKAKELMRHTDLKAYEIAIRVGYDTAAYYSTAFKKVTGYSPSEYKKMITKLF